MEDLGSDHRRIMYIPSATFGESGFHDSTISTIQYFNTLNSLMRGASHNLLIASPALEVTYRKLHPSPPKSGQLHHRAPYQILVNVSTVRLSLRHENVNADQYRPQGKQHRDPHPVRDDKKKNEAASESAKRNPAWEDSGAQGDDGRRKDENARHPDGEDVQKGIAHLPREIIHFPADQVPGTQV